MRKFLLTTCAFGLFFSAALSEEKSIEQLDSERNRIWGAEGLQSVQLGRVLINRPAMSAFEQTGH
jgi:hypothetical protein